MKINLKLYEYKLPENLIAKTPAVPRDGSRLFVYNTRDNTVRFDKFYNLDKYLPQKSFLVLNNTKVLPAKVTLRKANGGKVICLLLTNELIGSKNKNIIRTLVNRKINIGEKLFLYPEHFFSIIKQEGKIFC